MFPYLTLQDHFTFPDPKQTDSSGILAAGGNLSPGMLLSAYRQGVFPWFNPGEEILWWCPDPRFVLFPQELHISKSMGKLLSRQIYSITFDHAFAEVIRGCAERPRPGQDGTWITDEMLSAYIELNRLGYAHSVEARDREGHLAGGLYGVCIGGLFCGESMYSLKPNASKAAFVTLVQELTRRGVELIDSQVHTGHLETLGAKEISRKEYLNMLDSLLQKPDLQGSWAGWV